MKKVASRTRSAKKSKPIPYRPSLEAERLLKRVEQIAEALDVDAEERPKHVRMLQRLVDGPTRSTKSAAVAMVSDMLDPRAILALERMPEDDQRPVLSWLRIIREIMAETRAMKELAS